jgi:hypothetical protein
MAKKSKKEEKPNYGTGKSEPMPMPKEMVEAMLNVNPETSDSKIEVFVSGNITPYEQNFKPAMPITDRIEIVDISKVPNNTSLFMIDSSADVYDADGYILVRLDGAQYFALPKGFVKNFFKLI